LSILVPTFVDFQSGHNFIIWTNSLYLCTISSESVLLFYHAKGCSNYLLMQIMVLSYRNDIFAIPIKDLPLVWGGGT